MLKCLAVLQQDVVINRYKLAVDALTTNINTQSNKFVQVFSSKVKQQSKCFITTKWTADNVRSTVKCYCQSNFGYVKKQYVNFSLQLYCILLYCLLDEVKIHVALGFHTGRRKRKACLRLYFPGRAEKMYRNHNKFLGDDYKQEKWQKECVLGT